MIGWLSMVVTNVPPCPPKLLDDPGYPCCPANILIFCHLVSVTSPSIFAPFPPWDDLPAPTAVTLYVPVIGTVHSWIPFVAMFK